MSSILRSNLHLEPAGVAIFQQMLRGGLIPPSLLEGASPEFSIEMFPSLSLKAGPDTVQLGWCVLGGGSVSLF